MNKLLTLILILFAGPCFTSCDTSSDNAITLETMCSEPRPEVCTMEHDPVCGYKLDGTSKTYSNGCSACTEKEIIGYNNGECD
jgi:hypothetical protein